jgi:methionine-rich copper-binding protein CopC
MTRMLRLPATIATLTFAAAFPQLALAHALLVSSTPQANGVVQGTQVHIVLQFDSRVDASRSLLSLVSPDGQSRTLQQEGQGAPNQLSGEADDLTHGAYTLHWQALSSDGHLTRGEIPFRVE